MEKDASLWKKRKTKSKIHWPLRDFKKSWTSSVAYRFTLPLELAKLHDVFHMSMFRSYRSDTLHILPVQDIQVQEDFTFDEEPKAILDREIRQLQNKQVPLVKVLWQHHGMEEATWEPKSTMRV